MPDTSLLSLVLTLRPLTQANAVNAFGRASHALLLDAVRWADPALAEHLHAGDGLRPFTASDLIGYSRKAGLHPDRTHTLRLTALTNPVARALLRAESALPLSVSSDGLTLRDEDALPLSASERGPGGEVNPPLSIGALLRLDTTLFRIEAVTADPGVHPLAGSTTYEALSAPWLLGRETPDRHVTLHFASPTTFKSGGRHVPLPLPDLVFGNLLERWNAFAPVALPAEVRRYAQECLALGGYSLRTRAIPVKEGGLRIGMVGQARYTAVNYDRYWLSLIRLLADFAFFAGVGAGTTTGLGQCRNMTSD